MRTFASQPRRTHRLGHDSFWILAICLQDVLIFRYRSSLSWRPPFLLDFASDGLNVFEVEAIKIPVSILPHPRCFDLWRHHWIWEQYLSIYLMTRILTMMLCLKTKSSSWTVVSPFFVWRLYRFNLSIIWNLVISTISTWWHTRFKYAFLYLLNEDRDDIGPPPFNELCVRPIVDRMIFRYYANSTFPVLC